VRALNIPTGFDTSMDFETLHKDQLYKGKVYPVTPAILREKLAAVPQNFCTMDLVWLCRMGLLSTLSGALKRLYLLR